MVCRSMRSLALILAMAMTLAAEVALQAPAWGNNGGPPAPGGGGPGPSAPPSGGFAPPGGGSPAPFGPPQGGGGYGAPQGAPPRGPGGGPQFGIYFSPVPFWPPAYVQPPTVYVTPPTTVYVQPQQAASSTYWYYCPDPAGYYPYVSACPKGWMTVVPQTPTK